MRQHCRNRGEKGQTIVLAAISLLSLLAMAALAIDVVTLYVARTEIQRATDAAALAAGKAIADSGITTLPNGDTNCAAAQTLAVNMANAAITAVLPNNLVSGSAPSQAPGSPAFLPLLGGGISCPISNPQVTVSLQQTNLPTLFARIWSSAAPSVKASATAEAYNPANPPSSSSYAFTPIAPTSVKPWLVANQDPTHYPSTLQFINTTTGVTEAGLIGEQFDLTADCRTPHPHHSCALNNNPPGAISATQVQYVPADTSANAQDVCPSCAGGTDYEQSIACADANSYKTYANCGGTAANISWVNNVNPGWLGGPNPSSIECLTNATALGGGQGQDELDNLGWPSKPFVIRPRGGGPPYTATSSSVVSIPLIDPTTFPSTPGAVTVVGFLQAFINCVEDGTNAGCGTGTGSNTAGDINITVLNVVGCSNNPNANPPVVGGTGASAIPVRLISQ
jgi:Putative Flp pilus-assembly TadE/G-like